MILPTPNGAPPGEPYVQMNDKPVPVTVASFLMLVDIRDMLRKLLDKEGAGGERVPGEDSVDSGTPEAGEVGAEGRH